MILFRVGDWPYFTELIRVSPNYSFAFYRVLLRRHKKRIHKLEWEKELALIGPENMDGRSARFIHPQPAAIIQQAAQQQQQQLHQPGPPPPTAVRVD